MIPKSYTLLIKKKGYRQKIYTFGIHPLHNPKISFELYEPLVDYLNNNLENKKIEIKLEASRNYDFSIKNYFQESLILLFLILIKQLKH